MPRSSSKSSLINSRRNNVLSQSSAIPWTAQNCYPCLDHTVTYVLTMFCYLCLDHGPSRKTQGQTREKNDSTLPHNIRPESAPSRWSIVSLGRGGGISGER